MKLLFSRQIFEKYANIKFYEIRPVETKFFHADGRTDRRRDMMKLTVALRNFAKAPKKRSLVFT